jgi:hypothetical protein
MILVTMIHENTVCAVADDATHAKCRRRVRMAFEERARC